MWSRWFCTTFIFYTNKPCRRAFNTKEIMGGLVSNEMLSFKFTIQKTRRVQKTPLKLVFKVLLDLSLKSLRTNFDA